MHDPIDLTPVHSRRWRGRGAAAIMVVVDVAAHLRNRLPQLAPRAERVLAAVSGGADSVALLRGLVSAGFEVVAAHLDHALRPESAADARFVTELAERLGIEVRVERVEVAKLARERALNLEAAGRRVRYEFLTRSARECGADLVVTAHTLDDQAETVLMQLLRGAAYLRGMQSLTGRVARPLLELSHEDLEGYLKELGQEWREDPSNRDRRYLRAWLRSEVLPLLSSRFPTAAERLASHALIQQDVADFVRRAASELRRGEGYEQEALLRAHPAVQREALRLLFDEAGVAPESDRIEEFRARLGEKHPVRSTLTPDLSLRLAYGRLELARQATAAGEREVTVPEELPDGLPESVLEHPDLVLRARRPGDRMRLPGGSKSLSRVLMDRKVPREERDGLLVLASGKRVLWAEGVGAAADVETGSPRRREDDELFMERALILAREGAEKGELPVGAVVTRGGKIVGEGHNETEASGDPTAHAELLAMRRAAREVGDWRLSGCTLYVTLEPCPMCAGSTLISHLERVVYGAANRRDGAFGSVTDLQSAPWKRRLEVRGGVRAREAGELLSRFFAARRS